MKDSFCNRSGTNFISIRTLIFKSTMIGLVCLMFISFSPIEYAYSQAVSVSVTIVFDSHYTEFTLREDSQHNFSFPGKVICEIDGLLEDEEFVLVELRAGDTFGWSVGVGPSPFKFYSNCIKNINVTLVVPPEVRNRTVNRIWIDGSWEIEPYDRVSNKAHGDAVADYFDAKIIRKYPRVETSFDSPEGSDSIFDRLGWPCIIGIIIGIISIIAVIYFYYKVD